MAGEKKQKQWS